MIRDLSDDRRAGKPGLPADDRDVTNGLVVADSIEWDGRPVCARHGAMHRVDQHEHPEDGSLAYRCSTCGVGAKWWSANHKESKIAFRVAWDDRFEAGRAGLRL